MPQVNIMQATASECRPAVPAERRGGLKACRDVMELAFNDFLVNNRVDKVILAASWKDEDLPNLSATLDTLKSRGIDVVVLGPIVEYAAALPRLLIDGILRDHPALASTKRTPGIRERDRVMSALVKAHGASYSSVYDAVCRDGHCDEFVEADIPMQFDEGHLTDKGAAEVGRRLSAVFGNKLTRTSNVSN
jgi:hypothetical protein